MKRILIALVILTTLILTACAPTPAAPTQNEGQAGGAAPASVALDFAGWNYDSEKAHDILKNYENWIGTQYDPKMNVSVTMADSGYGEYDTFITTNYAGGGKYDALYSSDHWLAKWAEAGWILPLEDYFPKAKEYMKDMSPFSVNALTYKGKVYGLPYYSDVMYFVYNENMLKEAGIVAPPTTWAEVTEQSLLLKEKGISETPLLIGLQAGSWFDEAFFALAYSEGGDFFDENNNPIFETDKGPIFDMMEWLVESIHETEILPKKVMEMAAPNVQEAFKNGEAAFVIVPGYMMKEFNTPGISKIAGSAKISMMPGTTHATNGFTRLYVLGSGALENEETMAASLALIEYLGGSTTVDGTTTYHVAKRWSVENNLGFSANPLWNDPDVEKVFSSMADPQILAKQKALAQSKDGMQAPWFAEWISFVRTEVQKALLGESSTTTVLESVKQQWVELSQE
ncbi:MAG: extracellular solute-binding protein [Chloroflexi bacterium]|nr:MAG: extracellular solute-binding protein [Chloroflexota bacterium]